MNTHHDRMLAEPYADDEGFAGPDTESAIEEMARVEDCYDNWLSNRPLPCSVAHLLALLVYGVPVDDESRGHLDDAINAVQADFAQWAQEPERFRVAPVDAWISAKGAV